MNLLLRIAGIATVSAAVALTAALPAQALTKSDTTNCSSSYRVGVRGQNAGGESARIRLYLPNTTLREDKTTSAAVSYQSSTASGASWKIITAADGLTSASGGFCAPIP
jgi:hypothetical protein